MPERVEEILACYRFWVRPKRGGVHRRRSVHNVYHSDSYHPSILGLGLSAHCARVEGQEEITRGDPLSEDPQCFMASISRDTPPANSGGGKGKDNFDYQT